jgi:hypothetical protein
MEKFFDDGLEINGNVSTLGENSDGKVVYIEEGDENVLSKEGLFEVVGIHSLVFSLENDNLNEWYDGFIGALDLMSGRLVWFGLVW